MKKHLVAFLLFVTRTFALIEWPFYDHGFDDAVLNVTIGNPGQNFSLVIVPTFCDIAEYGVQLEGFEKEASSTFHKTGDFKDGDGDVVGITGVDDFVINTADGYRKALKQRPFAVLNGREPGGIITFNPSTPGCQNSFMDSIWNEEPEKIIGLRYHSRPATQHIPFTGVFSFGGVPDMCNNTLVTFPTISITTTDPFLWRFQIEKVSAGKFSATNPGKMYFTYYAADFYISPEIFDQVTEELGVIEYTETTYGYVPCNSNVTINYQINGVNVEVGFEDYADPVNDRDGDYCLFYGRKGYKNDYFELPARSILNKCILFNLDTAEIQLAYRSD